jgi:pimeloyl-ACP methyl ester carboxylesterase
VPHVSVADIDLYYESYGDGAPVLLLGGMAQPVADVRPLIDELAADFRVVAVDNRGTGRTSAPRGRAAYLMERMAEDACGLLDRLDIAAAHVVGVSMGGRAALALARNRPERVRRLVLISTSARVPPPPAKLRVGMLLARVVALRDPDRQPAHARRGQYSASRRFDYRRHLHEITQPTLVLHGRADPIVPLPLCQEMERGLPDSRLVLLDGGHRISLDPQPRAEISAAVRAFLREDAR